MCKTNSGGQEISNNEATASTAEATLAMWWDPEQQVTCRGMQPPIIIEHYTLGWIVM
jgi:hypothetical protein